MISTKTLLKLKPSSKSFSEILVDRTVKEKYFPARGKPEFSSGQFTVFEYSENKPYLPSFPYEIKECAKKIAIYNTFLLFAGRVLHTNIHWANIGAVSGGFAYIPLAVFLFQFAKILRYSLKMVSSIRLLSNGTHVQLGFKNVFSPITVPISAIKPLKELTFFNETFEEPYLFPVEVDFTAKYGKYSLFNKRTFFIYGDDHTCVKHGELFRAVLEGREIDLN